MQAQLLINDDGLCYSRGDLSRLPVCEEIKTAEAWIKLNSYKLKGFNRRTSSYRLKHWVEDFAFMMNKHFNTKIFSTYISNGAFIQAAINLGYCACPIDCDPQKAYFNMGLLVPNTDSYLRGRDA